MMKPRLMYYLSILLLGLAVAANAQTGRVVNGVVKDFQGSPLPGVSILVKGTTIGTASDADGNYSLQVGAMMPHLFFLL